MNEIVFSMRVKLPDIRDYHASPSGETEYESDKQAALFKDKPIGFEIHYQRYGYDWPVDKHGFTWVPLYLSDEKLAVPYFVQAVSDLRKQLKKIRDTLKELI